MGYKQNPIYSMASSPVLYAASSVCVQRTVRVVYQHKEPMVAHAICTTATLADTRPTCICRVRRPFRY